MSEPLEFRAIAPGGVQQLVQATRFARAQAVRTGLRAWRNFWRQRAARATLGILHSLDDRTLKDIGMDRSEIESVVCGAGDRRIWVDGAGCC